MAKSKIKRLYLIPILSKALDVIELLEQHHAPLTLEDVYQQTHISKTSVYRILKTLVHRGYIAQSQSGQYRLVSRPRRLRFGFAVQSADMPFSIAVAQSVTAAAAASGVEGPVSRPRSWPCSEGLEESLQSCFMVATSTSPSPSSDPQRADIKAHAVAARSSRAAAARFG